MPRMCASASSCFSFLATVSLPSVNLAGAFSTKIHLKTDNDGLPIGFHLTGGEAHDSRSLDIDGYFIEES